MSDKASVVLKAGRLVTSGSSATCGVQLQPEKTYLITGRVVAGQAYVSLCNYITPWTHLTVRQKKGFRLLYRQGCRCEVRFNSRHVRNYSHIWRNAQQESSASRHITSNTLTRLLLQHNHSATAVLRLTQQSRCLENPS